MINAFIKQTAILKKIEIDEKKKNQLKSLFISDHFLEQFTEPFKKLFSDKEICSLIEIYQSNAMKKILEHSKDLLNPLYNEMKKQTEKIAEQPTKD
jgi:hypothetical protein